MAYKNVNDVLNAVYGGEMDPYEAQILIANNSKKFQNEHFISPVGPSYNPWEFTSDQEKALNNLLSRYNSQNSLTWQAEQLQDLGLSNSGVLQTGGVHTASDMSNQTARARDAKLQAFSRVAGSMISMAGSMAGAGIHGAALAAVKGAAGQAASLTAHSARNFLSNTSKDESYSYNDLMEIFQNR